jgi:hypothetical protein
MRAISPGFAVGVLVLALVGCDTAAPPSGPPTGPSQPAVVISPIQIDSVVLVRGLETASGLGVHVQGIVGDGCSELLPIRQLREGSVVLISIERQRPRDAVCTQIAKLYDDVIALEGDFPPGAYTVRVNSTELAFSAP